MKKYVVFGNLIVQSLLLIIYMMFVKFCGIELEYIKIFVLVDGFVVLFEFFFEDGGVGCNVIMFFKEEVFLLVDYCNVVVDMVKVVNILKCDESGMLYVYNIDGIGLVIDFIVKGVKFDCVNVLLFGVGGVVKGVVQLLLEVGVKMLYIFNCILSKVQVIEKDSGSDCVVVIIVELFILDYEVVINLMFVSLQGILFEVLVFVFKYCNIVYDMVYGSEFIVFMEFVKEYGVMVQVDGLGMLVQ